jgi:hypothetical protein
LEFALEVEGYAVSSAEDLMSASVSSFAEGSECMIVDEDAIFDHGGTLGALWKLHMPIIMLVDRSRMDVPGVQMLRKPWFGNALTTAILSAVQGSQR